MEWIIDRLRESDASLVAAVSGLSDTQWVWRAGEGSWSAQEIVEHLILVERGVLTMIRRAMGQPAVARTVPLTDEQLWERLTRGSGRRAVAPERVRPTGQWMGREEALREWAQRRGTTLTYAQTTADPLRERWITLPSGELDGAQGLLMLAGHATRHIEQLQELRRMTGFPVSGHSN